MNMNSFDLTAQELIGKVRKIMAHEENIPLKVSIMGQTGVGKSSLINAIFKTNLNTDPVRPSTERSERIVVKGKSGRELWFYDLPGLGESQKADEKYLTQYRQMLIESDIVLWAIHADTRSFTFDLDALHKIIEIIDEENQGQLLSRITFILTKADLLTPPPWILAKLGKDGIFAPQADTIALLEQKELHIQENFIIPYEDLLTSQTYYEGDFDVDDQHISYDENMVYYNGFLDKDSLEALKERFPNYTAVFDRLYDNYRVISCSSRFRFNLDFLMRVIINKLGSDAVARFSNFYTHGTLDRVPLIEALKYSNIIVLDREKRTVIFDLANAEI